MNQGVPSSPEPDPQGLSLESLERQLRALPPSEVPEALSSKMIAAIPATKAGAGGASTVFKHWPWIAGVTLIFIAASGVLYSWHMFSNSNSSAASTENPSAVGSSTAGKEAPATSKAVQQYEKIVSVDPYNADAWFALAKAQADVHRSLDAISSAQKALDVARARNRSDLAGTIEAWLRSYHGTQSGRSTP